jgi:hypothetical protein
MKGFHRKGNANGIPPQCGGLQQRKAYHGNLLRWLGKA